jgi:hypothetical protein
MIMDNINHTGSEDHCHPRVTPEIGAESIINPIRAPSD